MVRLGGLEPPAQGLGNPCSILTELQAHSPFQRGDGIVYHTPTENAISSPGSQYRIDGDTAHRNRVRIPRQIDQGA